jgi:hypothetical protein
MEIEEPVLLEEEGLDEGLGIFRDRRPDPVFFVLGEGEPQELPVSIVDPKAS